MPNPVWADEAYGDLVAFLYEQVRAGNDIETLQIGLMDRLNALDMPMYRMHIGVPVLHPLYAAGTYTWRHGEGVGKENFTRSVLREEAWLNSPQRSFYEAGLDEGRIRIRAGSDSDRFPMLKQAALEGATDYFLQYYDMLDRDKDVALQNGVMLSWISSHPDGFSDADLDLLRRLHLPLVSHLRLLAERRLTADILDAYLGAYTGKRVLSGQIQRGDGEVIQAVVLFCDLRGSSALADRYSLKDFLDILNRYFEITAGTVIERNGEVLRYIGDASLAIFPFARFPNETAACRAALDAALLAVTRGRTFNAERAAAGEPPIAFGIGLHPGEVMYGNIGTSTRLEFSVIGAAANEAARIEDKCRDLGETILVSEAFVERLPGDWRSHGRFALRNIAVPMEIFSPGSMLAPDA